MQVSDDPRVGTELAGYRIESLLGLGGMSVVYLAEDLRLKRRVALKLLVAALAEDESFRERFLRESELAASIDHPNIVPIYEAGTTGDLLFIAMRYVEGRDLGERLRHGRLETGEAIGVLAQVASALDAAHARGLVHRDVKPSNVLLDRGARPDGSDHAYLADFGLTRRVADEARADGDGQLLGTIDYVAPELIAGADVDGRADVYSLGCVLHECLVGQPPFRRDSELAVVFAHLEEEAPAPSATRPELPSALDAVLATALAKDPLHRYPSCRELARAALGVATEEASRRLADAASRAAAGRSELTEVEAELAGKVSDLQAVREQARSLSGPATPARVAAEGICPFKGLASFEPVDAEYFFGRERLVAELVARLVGARFLGIVGPSGSGKSSALRAGLLPALAGGVLPGSERWRRVLLRPGERPLGELRRLLASGARDPLAEALDGLNADERILLAVDQLEELFTACRSDAERAAFAGSLSRAAADPGGRAVVVVALRADFYGRFAAYADLAELLGGNHVLVGPMQASELRRAVELPAARVGLRVEPELTDALVDDVEGEPGALPLLSTALLELWQKREGTALALAAYREAGGVHGAVARLAEATYAGVANERRPIVRAVMLRLVGEGERDTPVGRRAPLRELDVERNEDVAAVLAALADSRLLTVDEGSVEVAHEALLREWPRLREWIEEDADGRRLRRHLTRAAVDWDAAGRDQSELYRGARLAAVLDWSTDHAFELNALEREFVTESRDASEQQARLARRTNRRLGALLAGVALLLAAAVAVGIFALVQRGEARNAAARAGDAETAQLAQRLGAQALVEEQLARSLLLARQAVALHDTPQTRGYLLSALLRSPAAVGMMHEQSGAAFLRAIDVSPDGETLAVGGTGGMLLFFDARTYEQVGEPLSLPAVEALAYSRDGKTLAIGGWGYVRVIDARTHETLAEERGHDAFGVAFTDDERLVVVHSTQTGSRSPAWVTVRDASTLKQVAPSISPDALTGQWSDQVWTVPSVALTRDGRSLVTASDDGELRWWDPRSGKATRTIEIAEGYRALAVSGDGLTVALGFADVIQIVDARSGAVRESTGPLASPPTRLLFSPDGGSLVATSLDGPVTVWDVDSASARETLAGHGGSVQQLAFSPDGGTLYTASHDGTAIAWDLTHDRRLGRPFKFTHDRGSRDISRHPGRFSPDGRLIAVGLKGQGVQLWDVRRLTRVGAPLLPTGGEVQSIGFSPDGRTLAAGAWGGTTTAWDLESRSRSAGRFELSGTLPDPEEFPLNFSPDGTLATSGGNGVMLWDARSGRRLGRLGDRAAADIAFSPTGRLAALLPAYSSEAEIWDVRRRSRGVTLSLGGGVISSAAAFSPDGRMLATGSLGVSAARVQLWDVATGAMLREIEQNVGGVRALEFTPDGSMLAVSGFGQPFVSLWDVATGAQVGPRLRAGNRGVMIDISPDGRSLLQTHGSGHGAIWDIDPASWARRACALANRTLTREEWKEFLPGRPYEPSCRD